RYVDAKLLRSFARCRGRSNTFALRRRREGLDFRGSPPAAGARPGHGLGCGGERGFRKSSPERTIVGDDLVGSVRDERDDGGNRSGGVGGVQDAAKGPGGRGLDLHGGFIGLDLEEDVARRDGVADALVPGDDSALVHREPELGQDDTRDAQATSSFAVRMMSSTCGTTLSSRCCAYGIGVSSPARRFGGASRSSNASSAT